MQKINIANVLLTRRCNLSCSYCRIATTRFDDYVEIPDYYPNAEYHIKNEKSSEEWIDAISRIHNNNKECFFILYGGEPFIVWEKLADIVTFMNNKDIPYTIISSCNEKIKPLIYKFFEKVGHVTGFTASIDPYLHNTLAPDTISRTALNDDELYKTHSGYYTLLELMEKSLVKDPVAEITCDAYTIGDLEKTVQILTEKGICSDITVLDISKNNAYDFSSITNPAHLVEPTEEVREVFTRLQNSNYNIHMKDHLLKSIFEILPSNVDCELEKGLHNVTIEPDLSLRLCLRIRGKYCPDYKVKDILNEDGTYNKVEHLGFMEALVSDKATLCKGCSWSCVLMSKSQDTQGIINH